MLVCQAPLIAPSLRVTIRRHVKRGQLGDDLAIVLWENAAGRT
jgi:hypothetical protein